MPYRAECACKRTSITLAADPIRCFVCHCDYCQRSTGSVGVAAAVFNGDDVVSIDGEFCVFDPEIPKFPGTKRYFCANCGVALHWENPAAFSGLRLVSLGCFEDSSRWGLLRTVQNQFRPTWCPQLDAYEIHDVYGD